MYDTLVKDIAEVVLLLRSVVQAAICALLEKKTAEIKHCPFGARLCMFLDDKLSMSYNLVEASESHLSEILPYLLCEECEIVYEILVSATEMFPQCRVLCCYSHWACVEVALAHHHTSKYDESCCSESIFLSSKKCHEHNVTSGLELTIYLKPYLSAQSVLHECLLCL